MKENLKDFFFFFSNYDWLTVNCPLCIFPRLIFNSFIKPILHVMKHSFTHKPPQWHKQASKRANARSHRKGGNAITSLACSIVFLTLRLGYYGLPFNRLAIQCQEQIQMQISIWDILLPPFLHYLSSHSFLSKKRDY